MRYFSSFNVYSTWVSSPTFFIMSSTRCGSHPALSARAAASTCQPAGTDKVLVSITVTLASGTIAAPASAEFTVPLNPEEM